MKQNTARDRFLIAIGHGSGQARDQVSAARLEDCLPSGCTSLLTLQGLQPRFTPKMVTLSRVPCYQVTTSNLKDIWPTILCHLRTCHWAAIDLEFSGIGPKENLIIRQLDDRYQAISEVAKTRSVLSVGISFFKFTAPAAAPENTGHDSVDRDYREAEDKEDSGDRVHGDEWPFLVGCYNLLTRCSDEYITEPDAAQFLEDHGFDFALQSSVGLPYYRGNDMKDEDSAEPSLRNLFAELFKRKTPLVLHNAFMDLIFIYQSFYCQLPSSLQSFVADLSQLFPTGIYDTKYITDFHVRLRSSYLEYIFYERQRFNVERMMRGRVHVTVAFQDFPESDESVEYRDMKTIILDQKPEGMQICNQYSYHGWCQKGVSCYRSHNIDYILDAKRQHKSSKSPNNGKQKMNKLKRLSLFNENLSPKVVEEEDKAENGTEQEAVANATGLVKSGIHRSGYDAFMTGYCFAVFLTSYAKRRPSCKLDANQLGIKNLIHNIYLTGRDQPLKIVPSSFAKPSAAHREKLMRLNVS